MKSTLLQLSRRSAFHEVDDLLDLKSVTRDDQMDVARKDRARVDRDTSLRRISPKSRAHRERHRAGQDDRLLDQRSFRGEPCRTVMRIPRV
jgi:hypothetical protein